MLHHYLQRALNEYDTNNIGPLQLLNVIRICRGQTPIRNGVSGEEHYASVACRENKLLAMLSPDFDSSEVAEYSDDDLEQKEIEEIASLYNLKI